MAKLFGQAYLQAATMLTAMNGFRKCGIWPLDRNVFSDADFIASETTNTETLPSENINLESTSQVPTTSTSTPIEGTQQEIDISEVTLDEPYIPAQKDTSADRAITESIVSSEVLPQPSTSAHLNKDMTPERQIQPASSSFSVTPESIIAIPKEVRTKERKLRRRGKTAILTASPYKNDLINEINKRQKVNKTTDKKETDNKKAQKQKPEKKKAEKKNITKRRKKESDTDSSGDEENDCPCIYCGYLYSESTEGWVICSVCHGWAHNSCAGVDEDDEDAHICELCQPE